ncbi:MAG: CRISPR-associated endonuclease Cas1, partial [Lentisphaeria bacterium]
MMSLPDFNYKQLIFFNTATEKVKMRFQLENIIIENDEGKIIFQHSCHRIFTLFIIGNLSVTNIVLQKAKAFGFPIILLNRNLRLYCYINNHAEGNFLLRQKQYLASPAQNLAIAQKLVQNKIDNQATLLDKIRHRSHDDLNAIAKLKTLKHFTHEDSQSLRSMEAFAAKTFFQHYFRTLNWSRRAPRTKEDATNLLLDMGYSYLFYFVEAIAAIYGFDLFCGVFHRFFYQRKSLVCDLV